MFLDAEASQENFKRPEKAPKRHPKRHPKVVQNLVKKWLKSEPKNEQTNTISMLKISLRPVAAGAVFQAMGPSKNAYFEDVKKLFKMPKNDPKMIQKWFKIAYDSQERSQNNTRVIQDFSDCSRLIQK